MSLLHLITPSAAPQPFGHYSQGAVTPDGTIWVSAQLPVGGTVTSTSPAREQAHRALSNVLSIIEAAGGRKDSVAKVNIYLTDISDWDVIDGTFGEIFGTHRPARAVVQVAGLHHGFRVAADAMAWKIHE
jgi:reactive intermediate/imine deaminase